MMYPIKNELNHPIKSCVNHGVKYSVLKSISTMLLASTLAACGSSGGGSESNTQVGSDEFLTGTFSGLKIIGLGYETDSQAGITDENGQFQFASGESIAFGLGDIQFGGFSAKEELSLKDIEGYPTTEQELLSAIAKQSTPNDFDLFVNVFVLMMLLDQDGVIDNTIDLRGISDLLVDTHINFNLPLALFVKQPNLIPLLFRAQTVQHDLRADTDAQAQFLAQSYDRFPREVISRLYEASEIAIESTRIREVEITTNLGTTTETFDYDLNNQIENVSSTRSDAPNLTFHRSFTWKSNGALERRESFETEVNGSEIESRNAIRDDFIYDDANRLERISRISANGTLETARTAYEYDESGKIESITRSAVVATDDPINQEVGSPQPLETLERLEYATAIENISMFSRTELVFTTDLDNANTATTITIDETDFAVSNQFSRRDTTDAQGRFNDSARLFRFQSNLLEQVDSFNSADPNASAIEAEFFDYNADDTLRLVERRIGPSDTVFELLTYDEVGFLKEIRAFSDEAQEQLIYRAKFEVNEFGSLLKEEIDNDGNGVFETVFESTFNNQNLITSDTEIVYDNNTGNELDRAAVTFDYQTDIVVGNYGARNTLLPAFENLP